jgi:hypothetical protein
MTNKKGLNKKYRINPVLWFIQDENSVKFHIQNDDYFGTIATILDLIEQSLARPTAPTSTGQTPTKAALLKKTLLNLKKDLLFLQNNYKITNKTN